MGNAPKRLLGAALLLAAAQLAGPAAAHEDGEELLDVDLETVTAQQHDVEDDIPADADFEERAAAWRQWLQEREDQRRREGWAHDETLPEPVMPPLRGPAKHTLKRPQRGIRAESKGDGRQHHILGQGHPLPRPSARNAPPAKPAPVKSAKKPAPAKKRR